MTILSKNLKTIRKSLHCTQSALAAVLEIGFRTYVRYEAGERDAPISILIKIARLGNISLDRLLTTEITPEELEIPDEETLPKTAQNLPVIGGSLEEGRLVLKGLQNDFLITNGAVERKLLARFRKLDKNAKENYLLDMEWLLGNPNALKKNAKKKKAPSKKAQKTKAAQHLRKMVKSIKKITLRG